MSRAGVLRIVVVGLGVALLLAGFLSPLSSSAPDGFERVASDQGFAEQAEESAGHAPFADYAVPGLEDHPLGTGLAGLVGTLLVFGVGLALTWLVGRRRRSRPPDGPEPS